MSMEKKIAEKLAQMNVGDEGDSDSDSDADFGMEAPKSVLRRVSGLKKIKDDVDAIVDKYKEERIALEQKYAALKKPLNVKRDQVIAGEVDFDETVFEGRDADELELYRQTTEEGDDLKGIPHFWFQAMTYHPQTCEYIEPADAEALKALKEIKCEVDEKYKSFKLTFSFEENDYFTNDTLEKSYVVDPDLLDENFPSLESATGTEIDWKEGKNLCVKTIQKKQRAKSGKRKGETRVQTVTEEVPSFFHFFRDPREPEEEDEEDEDEEKRNPHLDLEEDYEIAHAIRTSLLPEAVLWYTGENLEEDMSFEGDEEEDDDEEEEDDEDDEDDEDAPELVSQKPTKGRGAKGSRGVQGPKGVPPAPTADGEKPPECKQN